MRSRLTRFGIGANQFGASSSHKGATAALVDDRRQLFAYAEWTATGILAFLLGLARAGFASSVRPTGGAFAKSW